MSSGIPPFQQREVKDIFSVLHRVICVRTQVDIWSCGVVLYIMLSGIPPFHQREVKDKFASIRRGAFSFPPHLFANVSEEARCVRVSERERERERECLCACFGGYFLSCHIFLQMLWQKPGVCVYVNERERERECVCVFACMSHGVFLSRPIFFCFF